MKQVPLPLFLVAGALCLALASERAPVEAAVEGGPESNRMGELERRVTRMETRIGRDALEWRGAPSVASRLGALEQQVKELRRGSRKPTAAATLSKPDPQRMSSDLARLKRDLDSVEDRVKSNASQLARARSLEGSTIMRRDFERLEREVEKLRSELERLERR